MYNIVWTLDSKICIHARLSNTSYMRLHSWTSVYIVHTRTSANFPHYILSRHRDEGFVSNGSKILYMITKYIHAPWNYQINLLVSLWFLFCFVFISDESVTSSFNQKYRKSFYSYDKNKLFSYDIIRGIQQATNHFFFFFFFVNQRGNQKKTHFALFGSRSKHRFSCSLAGPTTTSK